MEIFLEKLTSVLLLIIFARLILLVIKRLKQGYFSVAFPAVGGFFIFLGFPILLNFLFGKPNYDHYPGLQESSNYPLSSLYYNIFIILVCILFYRYIKINDSRKFVLNRQLINNTLYKYRYLFWIIAVLPLLFVILSGSLPFYYEYKAAAKVLDPAFLAIRSTVNRLSLIAALSISLLIFTVFNRKDKSLIFKVLLILILLASIFWIDGKRGIFFKFFFIFLVGGILTGSLKPKKIFKYLVLGITVLSVVVLSYGKDLKFDNSAFAPYFYDNLRINIGRDHTVKYTLYKEFIDNDPILEYRGQSFVFDLSFFVPRSIWSEKPYPYAVYFVTSVYDIPPEPMGWSLTTCILEEMISNFGFLGMIIGPYFLLWICRVGDNSSNIYLKLLAILNVFFFLFTQLIAFMPIFLLFIILHIWSQWKRTEIALTQ